MSVKTEYKSGTNSDHSDHLDLTIARQKKDKAVAKTAVTKCKNKLLKLIGKECHDGKAIGALIDQLEVLQTEAIATIMQLVETYMESGDTENAKKTSKEIHDVEDDSNVAMDEAKTILKTLELTDLESVYSGLSKLFDETKNPTSTSQAKQNSKHSNSKPVNNKSVKSGGAGGGESKKHHTPDAGSKPDQIGEDLWRQLKKVSIPMFSGDVREYEGWRAAFMTCIDRSKASNEYKLLQLKQYLGGDAAKLVARLGHSAAVYDVALERLDRKYGGKRRQIGLHMEEISKFRPLRPGCAKDLDEFADLLDIAVVTLREADKEEELGDGYLYAMLLQKLTENMIHSYKLWCFENDRSGSVTTLREWVLRESEFQTEAFEIKQGYSGKAKSGYSQSGTFYASSDPQVECPNCLLCKRFNHQVWQCKKFLSLDVTERWRKAHEIGVCFRCLNGRHLGRSCTTKVVCGIDGCKANHHRLLHEKRKRISQSPKLSAGSTLTTTSNANKTTLSSLKDKTSHIGLRTVPVRLTNGDKQLVVNALLDDASTQTYINESVASELELTGEFTTVSVNVVNNRKETFNTQSIHCELESLDGSVKTHINALTTQKVTGNMKAIDWGKNSHQWSHLKDISFPKMSSKPIIDGIDHLDLHTSRSEVTGNPGDPIARLTPLGWTCIGPCSGASHDLSSDTFFTTCSETDFELNEIVQKFWEMDKSPDVDKGVERCDDAMVEEIRNSTTYDGERYTVEIPWKDDPNKLPDNYAHALRRLENVEKKLSKDTSLSEAYEHVIEQYVEKGYVRKVPKEELSDNQWLLPHFPVVKLDRETTKVRIVFDASANCKGSSLNDFIDPGPKLQNDLFDILLRFRRFKVGLICDIAEMYLQIEVADKDRAFLRFLWRSMDSTVEPSVYEFSRLVFGLNCSPFLAQFVSRENARVNDTGHEMASEVVSKSTYMDDSMDSVPDDNTAVELYEQLKTLWSRAGMHARKWISNSVKVLENIPVTDRLKELKIYFNELPLTKALGLSWDSQSDQFQFLYCFDDELTLTKRQFLRVVARVFDPLGFISPFVIRAKILLQQMWIAGVEWDEKVDSEIELRARQWIQETSKLGTLSFPRCIQLQPIGGKFHVFVDASQVAYGAVVYSVRNVDDGITSSLVAAKSHVAPVKAVSIPRMELMAAVLGVKLLVSVLRALNLESHCATLWSDSLNVLWWIKSQSRTFKTFVANRVSCIQDQTNPSQWMYIPSKQNPADMLTKGVEIETLAQSEWLAGPEFLRTESEIPKQIVDFTSCKNLETKKPFKISTSLVTELTTDSEWRLDPSRFSSINRLSRITAWVLRFVHNVRVPTELRLKGPLDVDELSDAEKRSFIDVQKEEFSDEYKALSQGKSLASNSKLLSLHPFLDDEGLLRLGGRLKKASHVAFDARCPIILPRKHWVTQLIVKSYHETNLHGGTNSTLASISSRFWIISAREAIREWERECSHCRKLKSKPSRQLMADLPSVRVDCSMRAFANVGIDFAGPFFTKQGRGKARQKRYLCLFTCLATRAVHLEIAYGLDTSAFLNAFFRMTHRRGFPKEVITDNGTNFVGAVRELRSLVRELDSNRIHDALAIKGIKWRFNPPQAPHFGGVFESLIKSAKKAIYAILSGADVTDEELTSSFIAAEDLINSRPLTYQSAHPEDEAPLTPNHFLHGKVGGVFAPDIEASSFHPQKRWRRVQVLIQHVWKRWMKEWLPSLNRRKKWTTPQRNFEIGDVVLVVSPETVRGHWPLGRITKVFPGDDGLVRVVEVKVGDSTLTRAVTKICPLEWSSESRMKPWNTDPSPPPRPARRLPPEPNAPQRHAPSPPAPQGGHAEEDNEDAYSWGEDFHQSDSDCDSDYENDWPEPDNAMHDDNAQMDDEEFYEEPTNPPPSDGILNRLHQELSRRGTFRKPSPSQGGSAHQEEDLEDGDEDYETPVSGPTVPSRPTPRRPQPTPQPEEPRPPPRPPKRVPPVLQEPQEEMYEVPDEEPVRRSADKRSTNDRRLPAVPAVPPTPPTPSSIPGDNRPPVPVPGRPGKGAPPVPLQTQPSEEMYEPMEPPTKPRTSSLPDPPKQKKPQPTERARVLPNVPAPSDSTTRSGPRAVPRSPPKDPLDKYDWYHQSIERADAERRLKTHSMDGMYLIRRSKRGGSEQQFTLMIYKTDRVYNLPLRKRTKDDKFALGNEKPGELSFGSLEELLNYFTNNRIKLNQTGSTALTKPMPK